LLEARSEERNGMLVKCDTRPLYFNEHNTVIVLTTDAVRKTLHMNHLPCMLFGDYPRYPELKNTNSERDEILVRTSKQFELAI